MCFLLETFIAVSHLKRINTDGMKINDVLGCAQPKPQTYPGMGCAFCLKLS
jgi:hypothetical protein